MKNKGFIVAIVVAIVVISILITMYEMKLRKINTAVANGDVVIDENGGTTVVDENGKRIGAYHYCRKKDGDLYYTSAPCPKGTTLVS